MTEPFVLLLKPAAAQGLTPEQACAQFWVLDKEGLITHKRQGLTAQVRHACCVAGPTVRAAHLQAVRGLSKLVGWLAQSEGGAEMQELPVLLEAAPG